MSDKVKKEDYLWIITETRPDQEETLVGMSHPQGEAFIPATREKDQALILLGRLPAGRGDRQVEAIHRVRLLDQAAEQGFVVYLVDEQGRVLERLGGPALN